MEHIYALGITCIQFVQEEFKDYEWFFEMVNDISNPHQITEIMFPLVSIVDSVFAAQLLLCMAFGGWFNAIVKWWLLEDRPYWWVQESSYYTNSTRPQLYQTHQTCETGPGSPSGHSAAMALLIALLITWAQHFATDRKWRISTFVQMLPYVTFLGLLGVVFVSRMFVAAHFPHQCIMGALTGLFLAPALCIYVSDPYIWRYGKCATVPHTVSQRWHIVSALVTIGIAGVTYAGLTACGHDPEFTIKLAYRWCQSPDNIRVTTTPLFALVQCTAYLLGWAVSVTPVIAEYRHYSENRSILISGFATALTMYAFKNIHLNICKESKLCFYISQYLVFATKPMILLRIIPFLAKWPFIGRIKVKSS